MQTTIMRIFLVYILATFLITPVLGSGATGQLEHPTAPAETTLSTTTRISVDSYGNQGNDSSFEPSISADGRFVAFQSFASNLVGGDTAPDQDVFVHDYTLVKTERVSVSSSGEQGEDSTHPSTSADGRYIAFESFNYWGDDTSIYRDIYVRDRYSGVTELISVSSDGEQGNDSSFYPSISADGRFVAFHSTATNLASGDTNGEFGYDVFVHDRQTGATELVSVSSSGDQGNGGGAYPSISADGQFVAFISGSSDLVSGDTNGFSDIFVHDRFTGLTELVSVSSNSELANSDSNLKPSISADGRYVAFVSKASNLVSEDTNGYNDIFVHDRQSGVTERVSVSSSGEQGNSPSYYPSISANGQFVTFSSYANNLVFGDTNDFFDIFVHDRQTGLTERVSVSSTSEQGNGDSYYSAISNDGHFVTFDSKASNLVSGDTNGHWDIFIRDREEVAETTYSIAGRVSDADGNPIGLVEITSNTGATAVTDSDGSYLIAGIPAINVQIYPSKSGYIFYPYSLSMNLTADKTEQDFVAYTAICEMPIVQDYLESEPEICVAPVAKPFLYLPFDTSYLPERYLQNWSDGGGINSWFDHKWPTYGDPYDDALVLYDGIDHSDDRVYRNGTWNQRYWYDGHDGLDLIPSGVKYGSSVLPAATGRVIEVCDKDDFEAGACARNRKLGRYIVISHLNNTYATLYAHLASISDWVKPGTAITRNDYSSPAPIGVMGGSGGNPKDQVPDLNENYWGLHLHFQVFFHGNNVDPWVPASGEVVDTFGWLPLEHSDDWLWPSVPLWIDFSPVSCIPGSEPASISLGRITAQIPEGAVPEGQVVTLSPTSFSSTIESTLRGIGSSFNLQTFDLPLQTNLQDSINGISSQEFILPVTVSASYSVTNILHLDSSQLAIYWFDSANEEWVQQETTLDPDNSIVTALITSEGYFDIQAPLVCPEDIYEPADDFPSWNNSLSAYQADVTFSRRFDVQEDQDWFNLKGVSGITYTIQTQNLAPGVDTILTLYDTDGETILATDDNSGGDLASMLRFQVPAGGIYYLRVSPGSNSAYGCESSYQLTIINDLQVVFLPMVTLQK